MTAANELVVRAVSPADLEAVALLHLLAFPDSALTLLGPEAVRRYYEWQLTGPHDALAFGVVRAGEMIGFCFGGVYRGALAGFMRHNRGYLAWATVRRPTLLANPLFRDRAAAGWRSLTRSAPRTPPTPSSATAPREPSFGILALAVHPSSARGGVGTRLMEHMESEAWRRGFRTMDLTVSPANHRAVAFYERLGWSREGPAACWKGKMTRALDGTRRTHEAGAG